VQILKSPPSTSEVENKAQKALVKLQVHRLKQYPSLDTKQREADTKVSGALITCMYIPFHYQQCR
jgi:hypothetical protein